MPVPLGSISIDEALITKQLKNDLKDDWFPDPLGYSEYFDKGLLASIIAGNFAENHGSYDPSQASLLNIPKGNFTLRYALETSVTDRAVYHALATHLLPYYDPLISWRVFSHRLSSAAVADSKKRSDPKYTFRNGISAWSDFLGCVQAKVTGNKVLLSTDLANYFENINLVQLHKVMIALIPSLDGTADEKSQVRSQVDQLFGYLPKWSYTADRGLPQNRDASSFLANLYMRAVDAEMIDAGHEYFRYMDDIKIVCDDVATARAALKKLVLALRPIGQFVNSGKTSILGAGSEELRRCLSSGSTEMKRINAAWQSKALGPISRSFQPLKQLTLRTLQDGKFDSREFRYCIGRLETLARCKEFEVPDSYFADITEMVLSGLDASPVSTDYICRYLRAMPLSGDQLLLILTHLTDPGRSLYNWKNYRLWVLLTQKEYRSPAALELAREIVRTREDDPTRAGATLYLGAVGELDDRHLIAERFSSLSSFLGQRSAIIAVHEVHYGPTKGGGVSIKEHVGPYIRSDLKGTYRALNREGIYVSKLEPMSITRFVDLERDYD